jgi:L-fuconolactonase
MMIIDTHTHFYDPTRPQGVPWPPPDDRLLYRTVLPEQYKALAVEQGISGTVVIEASGWLADNDWILDLAVDEPFIVGFVGHLDGNSFASTLTRLVANPLFRGIRRGAAHFADITAGRFLADMEQLASHDLSLDVLMRGQNIAGIVELARRLPELRIIVNHIGGMPVDGEALRAEWVDHYHKLASAPNIYLKVSALTEMSVVQPASAEVDFYRPALDVMWNAFGEDRLIYGSDWPVCELAGDFLEQGLKIVRPYFAEKGELAASKYFHRNAKNVYKWMRR